MLLKIEQPQRTHAMRCDVDAFIISFMWTFQIGMWMKVSIYGFFRSYAFNRKMSWDYAIQV